MCQYNQREEIFMSLYHSSGHPLQTYFRLLPITQLSVTSLYFTHSERRHPAKSWRIQIDQCNGSQQNSAKMFKTYIVDKSLPPVWISIQYDAELDEATQGGKATVTSHSEDERHDSIDDDNNQDGITNIKTLTRCHQFCTTLTVLGTNFLRLLEDNLIMSKTAELNVYLSFICAPLVCRFHIINHFCLIFSVLVLVTHTPVNLDRILIAGMSSCCLSCCARPTKRKRAEITNLKICVTHTIRQPSATTTTDVAWFAWLSCLLLTFFKTRQTAGNSHDC